MILGSQQSWLFRVYEIINLMMVTAVIAGIVDSMMVIAIIAGMYEIINSMIGMYDFIDSMMVTAVNDGHGSHCWYVRPY